MELVDLFELATAKLWEKSDTIISVVTLNAIADRALFDSAKDHPLLLHLKLDSTGIQWSELRKSAAELNRDEMIRAVAYFITDFIAIASSITDEILSDPLHRELTSVVINKKSRKEL